MTDTERLDRAIEAADRKVSELYNQKQKRRHARALIADLLEDPPNLRCIAGFVEIRSRAGIGGE